MSDRDDDEPLSHPHDPRCRKIAKDMAIDRTRSEMKGGKDSARPTDRADEHEAANSGGTMDAAIDRRKAIDKIAAQLSPAERPLFVKLALGSTQTEIAEELAMEPRQVSRGRGEGGVAPTPASSARAPARRDRPCSVRARAPSRPSSPSLSP